MELTKLLSLLMANLNIEYKNVLGFKSDMNLLCNLAKFDGA